MRAGIATLKELSRPGLYESLNALAKNLSAGLQKAVKDASIAAQVNSIGSLSTIFFAAQPVTDYTGAKRSDTKFYAHFFRDMLQRGIFLAPSQFEAAFVSAAHTSADIDRTISAVADALRAIAAQPPA
jgi:glutamate-1-semialdehyde 2,1-aminomutase